MLFVDAGGKIAPVAKILGLLRITMGLFAATQFDDHPDAEARDIGIVDRTGDAIDRDLHIIVVGIVIGLLTRIASNRDSSSKVELSPTRVI